MSFLNLPAELLDMIIHAIISQPDLNSLAQANRALHTLLNPRLYLNDINNNNASALIWAAQNDSVGTAKHVLEIWGFYTKRKWEQKPLFFAAQNGSEKVTKLLLKRGAKPDCRGPMQTPLYIAVTNQHVKIVKLLLRFKANPNSKNVHPGVLRANTPLHMAAETCNVAIVKELLASGAKIDVLNSKDRTPLDEASESGADEVCKILLEWAIKKIRTCSSKLSRPMLHCAVRYRDSKIVQTLLENGVDPDSFDLVHIPDNSDILRMLLEHDARPNRRMPCGPSLLADCLRFGCPRNAAMLIEYGADPNDHDTDDETPLHQCAYHLPALEFLVDHGAQLDARNKYGETPLFRAVSIKKVDTVRYLLQCGSDPCARTNFGETPLEHARILGHSDMMMLLKDAIKKRLREIAAVRTRLDRDEAHLRESVAAITATNWTEDIGDEESFWIKRDIGDEEIKRDIGNEDSFWVKR